MQKAKVFNHSLNEMEIGKKQACPRCKGFGKIFNDEDSCVICKGKGKVWLANSGWLRPLNSKIGNDEILY